MGGIPDARIVDQSMEDIRAKIVSVDGVTKHLKWSTGQLDHFNGAFRIVLLYSEMLYSLACRLQIDQRLIPVIGDVAAELIFKIRPRPLKLGNLSYTALVLDRYTER